MLCASVGAARTYAHATYAPEPPTEREERMAAEDGIYGATTDGVEKHDLNTFKYFYTQRPVLAGILAAEVLLIGVPLGLWSLARMHIWGVLFGCILTVGAVPALRFGVYSKDAKFRGGQGSCGPQCSCSPMCAGVSTRARCSDHSLIPRDLSERRLRVLCRRECSRASSSSSRSSCCWSSTEPPGKCRD